MNFLFFCFLLVTISMQGMDIKKIKSRQGSALVVADFDGDQKTEASTPKQSDGPPASINSLIEMPCAQDLAKIIIAMTGDESFLTKTRLHEEIGGKKAKSLVIAEKISCTLFNYIEQQPSLMPLAAYSQWIELMIKFERNLFLAVFKQYPDVLKQEKIASLSCAFAEKWKATELV